MYNIPDDKFKEISLSQGYLEEDELEKCIKLQKKYGNKLLYQIAFEEELIREEDIEAIYDFITNKKLIFGGYEVKSVLGEGGLGIVYLAKQLSMKRFVALKVLYPKWMKDDEFRKRFLLEARIAGKLSHPNLIQVFDIGYDKGRYFFSMEYVPGKTVEQLIEKSPLPIEKALDITLQILDALNYIWEKKLVHRDIKPSNIIINKRNIAKLGDFGFVKAQVDNELSSEEFVLGTPDYMSPEQAMGKELDYRSDIYSLGATLYHMITASAPYQGSESMIIRQHIKAKIPSPKFIDPTIPDDLCYVIEKMMAKLPEDRYRNYSDLRKDLIAIKEGNKPDLNPLEIVGKSTIERIENIPITKYWQLEKELKKLKNREIFYIIIIIFLSILLLIIFLFEKFKFKLFKF